MDSAVVGEHQGSPCGGSPRGKYSSVAFDLSMARGGAQTKGQCDERCLVESRGPGGNKLTASNFREFQSKRCAGVSSWSTHEPHELEVGQSEHALCTRHSQFPAFPRRVATPGAEGARTVRSGERQGMYLLIQTTKHEKGDREDRVVERGSLVTVEMVQPAGLSGMASKLLCFCTSDSQLKCSMG